MRLKSDVTFYIHQLEEDLDCVLDSYSYQLKPKTCAQIDTRTRKYVYTKRKITMRDFPHIAPGDSLSKEDRELGECTKLDTLLYELENPKRFEGLDKRINNHLLQLDTLGTLLFSEPEESAKLFLDTTDNR